MEKIDGEKCECGGNLYIIKDEKIRCLKCKGLYGGEEFADKYY